MLDTSNSAPSAENTTAQPADTPSASEAIEAKKESEPADERAAMEKAYDDIVAKLDADEKEDAEPPKADKETKRGPDGKFASDKPAQETAVKTAEGQQPAQAPVEPAKPAIAPPVSWSAEMKAKFGSLPPEVQTYVAERDKEVAQALSRLGSTAKTAEPFLQVAEQHLDYLKTRGIENPAVAFDKLLKFQRFMDSDPHAAITHLASEYGVKLDPNQDPETPQRESRELLALRNEIQSLKEENQRIAGHLSAQEHARQEAKRSDVLGLIEKFAADKPDWAEVESDVYQQVQVIRPQHPTASNQELLEKAYQAAIWANPKTRDRMLKAEAEKLLKAKNERGRNAREAASFNVSSVPGATPQFSNERAYLESIYDQAMAS